MTISFYRYYNFIKTITYSLNIKNLQIFSLLLFLLLLLSTCQIYAHTNHNQDVNTTVSISKGSEENEACKINETSCECCYNGFCFKYVCEDGTKSTNCPHDNCGPQKCTSDKSENSTLINSGKNLKIFVNETNIFDYDLSHKSTNAVTEIKNITVTAIPIYISYKTLLI